MKLTQEQIHFIDTYLKNSDVEYIDVRTEMVDHIATEVENKMENENLDFYNAFKNYMVVHKKEHQKANKQFIKTTDIKVIKTIGKLLIKPMYLALFALLFLTIKLVSKYTGLTDSLRYAPIVILFLMATFYFLSYRIGKKERYSGLERVGFLLIFVMQVFQLFFNPSNQKILFTNNENVNLLFLSFMIVLAIGFMQTVHKLRKEYTDLYKNKLA